MAKLQRVLIVLSLCLAPALFAQSADQEIVSVVDNPDPVTPGSTPSSRHHPRLCLRIATLIGLPRRR